MDTYIQQKTTARHCLWSLLRKHDLRLPGCNPQTSEPGDPQIETPLPSTKLPHGEPSPSLHQSPLRPIPPSPLPVQPQLINSGQPTCAIPSSGSICLESSVHQWTEFETGDGIVQWELRELTMNAVGRGRRDGRDVRDGSGGGRSRSSADALWSLAMAMAGGEETGKQSFRVQGLGAITPWILCEWMHSTNAPYHTRRNGGPF